MEKFKFNLADLDKYVIDEEALNRNARAIVVTKNHKVFEYHWMELNKPYKGFIDEATVVERISKEGKPYQVIHMTLVCQKEIVTFDLPTYRKEDGTVNSALGRFFEQVLFTTDTPKGNVKVETICKRINDAVYGKVLQVLQIESDGTYTDKEGKTKHYRQFGYVLCK